MTPILGIIASSFRSAAGPDGAYDALSTITVGASAVSSITFAGIPNTYKHLQIRALVRTNRADTVDYLLMQYNSDTSANYAWHNLYGTGSVAGASAGSSDTSIRNIYPTAANTASNIFGTFVIDVLDYANTSKNKTSRTLGGYDANGAGLVSLSSGLWNNTSAVNSVTFIPISGNSFVQYSQFTLYGVR
jgi:hypothetical protein